MSLTSEIVSKALFDVDITSEAEGVQVALDAVMDFNAQLSNQYFPGWVPTPSNLRYQRAIQQLDRLSIELSISDERVAGDTGDLLSLLLQVRDEEHGTQMTNQQLRDEAMTLFLADRRANAMSWIWFLLSQHPQVTRLQEELKTVLGGRTPTVADLRQLRYTEGVVLESMRLYPPVWGMSRVALRDCVMGVLRESWYNCVPEPVGEPPRPRFFDQPEVFTLSVGQTT